MLKRLSSEEWGAVVETRSWSRHPTRLIVSTIRDGIPPLSARVEQALIEQVLRVTARFAQWWSDRRGVDDGKEDLVAESVGFVQFALTNRPSADLDNLARAFLYTINNFLKSEHRKWVRRAEILPTGELDDAAQQVAATGDLARDFQLVSDFHKIIAAADPRLLDILERRANDETDDSIGSSYEITGSAVRQIVVRARKLFDGLL